jgi:hypothetical protein
VKRSVRDEWDVSHLYMEAMLGISLYSYPYFNYEIKQTLCLSYYCLYFLFNKIRDMGRADFCLEGQGERERVGGSGG